jgi:multiple sugar transport system substrate-binding protein
LHSPLLRLPVNVAAASNDQKVQISFWDENPGPERTPYLQELIKKFQSQNPNITVTYVGIPSNTAAQKYNLAIAAGETPDVGGCPGSWLSTLLVQNALLELDPYFSKWAEKDKIAPSYIQQVRGNAPDKKLYMLPLTANHFTLWYRADRFKAAGLKEPKTWNEFFAAVEKLTDKKTNQYGLSIRGGSGSDTPLLAGLVSYSGMTSFFDANGKCLINNPGAVAFLEKYAGAYKKYTPVSDITNGYKEMLAAFDSGIANMIFHNLGSYGEHRSALKEGQYAGAPYPVSITGKRTYLAGVVNGVAVFKNSKNPDAAWKFVSFLASADSQRLWNQKIGQIPTYSDLLKEPWVKSAQHISNVGGAFALKDTIAVSQPEYLPDYKNIRIQVIEPGFQEVLVGKKTAKDFLDELAATLEKSEKAYRATPKK